MRLLNRLLVASACVALLANHTHAADVKWAVGNAHWDAVTPNWLDGSANLTNYVAGNTVLFDDTAAGATPILVTNLLAVTNGSITISNVAKNYTLTGPGVFSNNVPLLKLGAGTLTLATTNANYGGTFAVGGGTVVLSTGAALGTAATGAAMILSNGVTLTIGNSGNATPAVPLVIAAGATVTNTANALGSGANGNVASGSASSVIYVNSSFTFGGQLTNFYGTLIANSGTTRLGVSSSGPTLGSSNAHFIVTGTLQPRNNNTTIHLGSLSGAGTLTGAQTPTTVSELARSKIARFPVLPKTEDWEALVGNFVINFSVLDHTILQFMEQHLKPEEIQQMCDLHLKDRLVRVTQKLKEAGKPMKLQTEFAALVERLAPLRDMRNCVAHGRFCVEQTTAPSGPHFVLIQPKDFYNPSVHKRRKIEFAELLEAVSALNALNEDFEKLAGYKVTWKGTRADLAKKVKNKAG